MSLYMRAVLREWHEPPFALLDAFLVDRSGFHLRDVDTRGWAEFEAVNANEVTVLAADLGTGAAVTEELAELNEFLDDLDETAAGARNQVRSHLQAASAIVGMQIVMSRYDESVAAANGIIDFLEQQPGVLTQVDTVGWYSGSDLLLHDDG